MLPAAQHGLVVQRLAARGGMAWVLQAKRDEQSLAVKVLYPELAANQRQLERFQHEAQALQRIAHPNVLPVVEAGTWGELPYLATPWQPGGTLADVIHRHRQAGTRCDFDQALRWLCDAARGLQALHNAGLVHRDVKPSNLLLQGEHGPLHVADLGIARPVDGGTSQTTTGTVAGTFHYIAPEVWQGSQTVDHRADQYSLGVVFYQLLTGEMPVRHTPPASQLNPTVPAAFAAVLERMMAKEPAQRYASLGELLKVLDAYAHPVCEYAWQCGVVFNRIIVANRSPRTLRDLSLEAAVMYRDGERRTLQAPVKHLPAGKRVSLWGALRSEASRPAEVAAVEAQLRTRQGESIPLRAAGRAVSAVNVEPPQDGPGREVGLPLRLRPLVAELRRRTLRTLRQQRHVVDFVWRLLGDRAAVVLPVIVAGLATGRLPVGPGRPVGEGRGLPPGRAVLLLQPLQQFSQIEPLPAQSTRTPREAGISGSVATAALRSVRGSILPVQPLLRQLQQRLDLRREPGDLSLEVGLARLELRRALRKRGVLRRQLVVAGLATIPGRVTLPNRRSQATINKRSVQLVRIICWTLAAAAI